MNSLSTFKSYNSWIILGIVLLSILIFWISISSLKTKQNQATGALINQLTPFLQGLSSESSIRGITWSLEVVNQPFFTGFGKSNLTIVYTKVLDGNEMQMLNQVVVMNGQMSNQIMTPNYNVIYPQGQVQYVQQIPSDYKTQTVVAQGIPVN